MESYKRFASYYDVIMEDVPYEKWVNNILYLCEKYKSVPRLILDLGCGTGIATDIFQKKGYDLIGVDISEEMLSMAREKNANILFLNQDMCEFELYGTVDLIYSICDSINYLIEDEDIIDTFKLVNNYLNPQGLFIFDLNTKYKFERVLGNNGFGGTYLDGDISYIWENFFDIETNINEYYLNLFAKREDGLYERHEEFHVERAYSIEKIIELIKRSGLEFLGVFDEDIMNEPQEDSQRIYIVAREKGKGIINE